MNDDPEIVLGGGDPSPSAPPASITSGLPTAVGTPIMATATAPLATAATPLGTAAAANTTSAGGIIERTLNDDGSLTVKITTTTPQPNGYREVKIEYFHIPHGVVNVVQMSLDQGDPPSGLYMTKMEQQTLPPGTGAVMSRPPAYDMGHETVPLAGGGGQHPNANVATHTTQGFSNGSSDGARACGICCGIACIVFIIAGIIGGATNASSHSSSYSPPSPSWPSWNPPSPYYPSWTPAPVYRPTWPNNPTRPWWLDPTSSPTSSAHPTKSPYPSYAPSFSLPPTSTSAPSDTPSISSRPSTSPPTMAPFAFPRFTFAPIFHGWGYTPPPAFHNHHIQPSSPTVPTRSVQAPASALAPVHYKTTTEFESGRDHGSTDGDVDSAKGDVQIEKDLSEVLSREEGMDDIPQKIE